MDTRLALMCGTDIPIPECQIVLHQPTIKEIALIGEEEFFVAAQVLCISKGMIKQGETLLANTTNFQIFMTIMTEKSSANKKEAVLKLIQLLFPKYKVNLLPRSLAFTEIGGTQLASIDDSNFDFLQEALRLVFCFNVGPMGQSAFNPADEQARKIAEKLMRGRQRVAAQHGDAQSSMLSQYLSVLTVGLNSMSLHSCMNLTMYQLFDLVERYSLYVDWDIDIRSRLAGAKSDKQPENWMKNIH